MSHPQFDRNDVAAVIASHRHKPGALLPIFHGIQDKIGYVPPESVLQIADALNLSRAEVHGTLSFYHYFRTTPPGRHTIRLCRAEACQAMNGKALERHAKERLGIDFHETDAAGRFSLEPVYCLGNCACAPSIMVGDKLHSRVTAERFDEIVESLQAAS